MGQPMVYSPTIIGRSKVFSYTILAGTGLFIFVNPVSEIDENARNILDMIEGDKGRSKNRVRLANARKSQNFKRESIFGPKDLRTSLTKDLKRNILQTRRESNMPLP